MGFFVVWVLVGEWAVGWVVGACGGVAAVVGYEGFCEGHGVSGVGVAGGDAVTAFGGADDAACGIVGERAPNIVCLSVRKNRRCICSFRLIYQGFES